MLEKEISFAPLISAFTRAIRPSLAFSSELLKCLNAFLMLRNPIIMREIEQFLISFNAKPTSRQNSATGTNPCQYTNDAPLPLQSERFSVNSS